MLFDYVVLFYSLLSIKWLFLSLPYENEKTCLFWKLLFRHKKDYITFFKLIIWTQLAHLFSNTFKNKQQQPLDECLLQELKKAFMDAYDKNRDGRIDIRELAQLLPLEESFKLLFKFETQVDSSVDFMRVSFIVFQWQIVF